MTELKQGLPTLIKWSIIGVVSFIAALILFNGVLFYNESGYQTHVRTIFGEEKVVTEVGYDTKWFGRSTSWKQAQTLQFTLEGNQDNADDSIAVSGFKVTFLGNVDSTVEASTRFRLPSGDQFLKIAREYRTPENFMATAVVPAVKETLQSTASLMTADDYFAGSRSEFGAEFENQLKNGQYIIKRKEVFNNNVRGRNQPAGLKSGGDLIDINDEGTQRSEFITEKVTDDKGNYSTKPQQFITMGVEVVEARITNILPNEQFRGRMVKVQTAQAELAVARQNRLKEEEEKNLVTARGEKEVEQKRQETLRDQIEQTTKAETEKKLAILAAQKEFESAEISKQTSAQLLEKAKIDAQSTKTLADAEAYQKRVVLEADGALAQKLSALVDINAQWANAVSKAPVSQFMMGGNAGGSAGRQSEFSDMMSLLTVKAAKDLAVDLKVK
jgi:regulator of protease activity HflC (stomatin/prohibitin superfamily)